MYFFKQVLYFLKSITNFVVLIINFGLTNIKTLPLRRANEYGFYLVHRPLNKLEG